VSAGEAEVRSPEYFTGTLSGSTREVDVTVRSKVGSADVLVMFECRDRAGPQDVRWIEEIAGKRREIGAHLAVAVTGSGGFTAGARTMANSLGIELRTVEAVTVEDVVGWCSLTHIDVRLHRTIEPDLKVDFFDNTPPLADQSSYMDSEEDLQLPLDTPFFIPLDPVSSQPANEARWLTGKELHAFGMHAMFEQEDRPDFSEWTHVSMTMSTPETPTVAVRTKQGLFPVARVTVTAQARIEKTRVPVSVHEVTDHNGETTQVVQAMVEYEGRESTVSFVHTGEGVAVMIEDREPDA